METEALIQKGNNRNEDYAARFVAVITTARSFPRDKIVLSFYKGSRDYYATLGDRGQ
jgi:hypothetical protein